ncbi:unnamed protein product [Closterium sp. NIES-53]
MATDSVPIDTGSIVRLEVQDGITALNWYRFSQSLTGVLRSTIIGGVNLHYVVFAEPDGLEPKPPPLLGLEPPPPPPHPGEAPRPPDLPRLVSDNTTNALRLTTCVEEVATHTRLVDTHKAALAAHTSAAALHAKYAADKTSYTSQLTDFNTRHTAWCIADTRAIGLINSCIPTSLQSELDATSSAVLWRALCDLYDRRDMASLHALYRDFNAIALDNCTGAADYTRRLNNTARLTGLHILTLRNNLLSHREIQGAGITAIYPGNASYCDLYNTASGRFLLRIPLCPRTRLYTLRTPRPSFCQVTTRAGTSTSPPTPPPTPPRQVSSSPTSSPSSSSPSPFPTPSPSSSNHLSHPAVLLHHRLGHPNFAALRTTITSRLLDSLPPTLPPLPSSPAPPCPSCIHGKLKQSPDHSHPTFAAAPLHLVHMDLWGPYPIRSRQGHRYMLVLVDNHSRRLHSDGGGKFLNHTLATYYKTRDIQQTHTLPHSPQQNGIAESRIREITKIARCLLAHASTPPSLLSYALLHAALLLNLRSHPQHSSSSPTELWSKAKPDAAGLRVWGSKAFVHIPPADCSRAAGKLDSRALDAFTCTPSPLSLLLSLSPSAAAAAAAAATAAPRAAKAAAAVAAATATAVGVAAAAAAGAAAAAAAGAAAAGAAAPAAAAATRNFPLLPFPPPSHAHPLPGITHWSPSPHLHSAPRADANLVEGKWVFRVKQLPGEEPVYKARYCAKCFTRTWAEDYWFTFAPTAKPPTLRTLLDIGARDNMEICSMDVSNAFLQGDLHERIFLRRPPGFHAAFPENTVWQLRRPVYGLKQAPREWHAKLSATLGSLGFSASHSNASLFIRSSPRRFILVYVDDMILLSDSKADMEQMKLSLQQRLKCKDLGDLAHYLGMAITRNRPARTITLSQSHYIGQVLEKFEMAQAKPVSTPLPFGHQLAPPPSPSSSSHPYAELVGSLMYAMMCTRPDLSYPISVLARFFGTGRHTTEHWQAAKRVLRYLRGTKDHVLTLGGPSPPLLSGFSDSFWADSQPGRHSSQGYGFTLGSGLVSWRSTRSSAIALLVRG